MLKYTLAPILLLTAAVSGYFWFPSGTDDKVSEVVQSPKLIQPLEPNTSVSALGETKSDVAIYRNEEFGFEFAYPSQYRVEETKMGEYSEEGIPDYELADYRYEGPVRFISWIEILRPDGRRSGLEVVVYHSGGMSLLDWIDYVNKGVESEFMYQGKNYHSVSTTTVAGQTGVIAASGCCMTCVKNFLFLKDGYIYKLSQSGHFSYEPELSGQCIKDADEFEKLVTSFRFWRDPLKREQVVDPYSKYAQPIRECAIKAYKNFEDISASTSSAVRPKKWSFGVVYYTSGADISSGVLIKEVYENSPAERAGLKTGDIIYAIDDELMVSGDTFTVFLNRHCPGDMLAVGVIRDGERYSYLVTLE